MPTAVLRTHNQGAPKTLPQCSVQNDTRTQNSVSATKETRAASGTEKRAGTALTKEVGEGVAEDITSERGLTRAYQSVQ